MNASRSLLALTVGLFLLTRPTFAGSGNTQEGEADMEDCNLPTQEIALEIDSSGEYTGRWSCWFAVQKPPKIPVDAVALIKGKHVTLRANARQLARTPRRGDLKAMLDESYEHLHELTGFTPSCLNIVIDGVGKTGQAVFSRDRMQKALEEKAAIGFPEDFVRTISAQFDVDVWSWNPDALARLKADYVRDKMESRATDEYPDGEISSLEDTKAVTARLQLLRKAIGGWEPFRQTFRTLGALPAEARLTPADKFTLFAVVLDRHAPGKDVLQWLRTRNFPINEKAAPFLGSMRIKRQATVVQALLDGRSNPNNVWSACRNARNPEDKGDLFDDCVKACKQAPSSCAPPAVEVWECLDRGDSRQWFSSGECYDYNREGQGPCFPDGKGEHWKEPCEVLRAQKLTPCACGPGGGSQGLE